jgi:splicing factor 3B subunit 5
MQFNYFPNIFSFASQHSPLPYSMADKYNILQQLEQLHLRYQGTGHADTTKHEWFSNMQRDTLAAHASHPGRLSLMALAENESVARERFKCLNSMIRPCGDAQDSDMEE